MSVQYLKRPDKPALAYRYISASDECAEHPTLVFLGGFRSDMEGTKAQFLHDYAAARGQAYLRFDYSGHGQSGGEFENGTIGVWAQDALDVITHVTKGTLILVGSSMGGWISFILAQSLADRIAGIVGIAAAPDFTRDFRDIYFNDIIREELQNQGFVNVPNEYSDEPYIITKDLIEDGENHCFLDKKIKLQMPVHLIQGKKDNDVPWKTAERIKDAIDGDVEIYYREEGDHRLSTPDDLTLLREVIEGL